MLRDGMGMGGGMEDGRCRRMRKEYGRDEGRKEEKMMRDMDIKEREGL